MTMMEAIADGFLRWIDCVAGALIRCRAHLRSPRTIRLVEQDAGEFTIEIDQRTPAESPRSIAPIRMADGRVTMALPPDIAAILPRSRVEIILQSNRFLFREVYLPARALEFLDGIVRAQIDRLTPWKPANAAFGFSPPLAVEHEQILITIAATSLGLVAPYLEAIADAGAHSIAVFAAVEGSRDDAVAIRVLEGGVYGIVEVRRVRRGLVATFAGAAVAAAGALCLAAIVGPGLENRREELSEQMARLRAAASATREPEAGTFSALVHRKQSVPATVLVLEELSQILPDHTSLTELHVENNKVRITGITSDAASLIGLLEQSSHFAEATFFAPTTRTVSEPGERFHIEARVHIGSRS
jgi:general secretion pathway protein L